MGRLPRYGNELKLKEKITGYFDKCEKIKEMPNIAGLCLFLDIDRSVLFDYGKKYPNTVKAAKQTIENTWVQRLGGQNATGAIFYLKNAFHQFFKDRHETDITSGGKSLKTIIINKANGNSNNQSSSKAD